MKIKLLRVVFWASGIGSMTLPMVLFPEPRGIPSIVIYGSIVLWSALWTFMATEPE